MITTNCSCGKTHPINEKCDDESRQEQPLGYTAKGFYLNNQETNGEERNCTGSETAEQADFTTTWQPPEPRCEQCKFYAMIDGGYGYCRRYPPQPIKTKLFKIKIIYPNVSWCEFACGEFKSTKKL